MLAVTVGLGFWQVERLAWKTELLAEIDRAEAAPPIPLPDRPMPFRRVVVEGTFRPSVAFYGAEVRTGPEGAAMGAQLISAIEHPGARAIIVDRGWAPLDFVATPPVGPQRIEGYVRMPEHGSWLGAKDDPARSRFFALDPGSIGVALGLREVAPFTLVALGNSKTFPQPATALPRPPNDHLSYAATWFSLSIALIVIFALFVRQSFRPEPVS